MSRSLDDRLLEGVLLDGTTDFTGREGKEDTVLEPEKGLKPGFFER